jgi:excisionase family DNA binding protein
MVVLSDKKGLTVKEVSALLRIGQSKVRALIKSGRLRAVNIPTAAGKSRFVVQPQDFQAFVDRHQAVEPKPMPRRRKPSLGGRDWYPDE